MQPTMRPPHDFAPTLRFQREDIGEPQDADDTIPFELCSRPYDQLQIEPATRPAIPRHPPAMCITASTNLVARDVERHRVDDPPRRDFRLALAIAILCATFGLAVTVTFLAL